MKTGVLTLSILFTMLFGLTLSLPAEAKRLGGGTSFGKSYDYKRTPKPATPAGQPGQAMNNPPATPAAAAKNPSGLLAPLAGLAAGGVLAAMFFGGAFEGIQILDVLLVAAIAFGLFLFFKRRRSAPLQAPVWQREAPASGPAEWQSRQTPNDTDDSKHTTSGAFDVPQIGSRLKGQSLSVLPNWFSEAAFMSEVNAHFRELQRHWDAGNIAAIAEYVTPSMLAHLREQREALLHAPETQVVELHSQLLDLVGEGDKVIAAIMFSGRISENGATEAQPFTEIWHVEHSAGSAAGDWLLAGILQHEA